MRISDECVETALFTVIVCNIFTSCREYPANKEVIAECLQLVIFAAYSQQKLKLFQAQGIIRPVIAIRT